MDRCKACRRPLTSEISRRYGFGPECLKRAVEEGNAPLESLDEVKKLKRERLKNPRAFSQPESERCEHTIDMFDTARQDAIRMLKHAIAECESYGVLVKCEITK